MKRFLIVVGICAMLVACGSSVKLDDVPVEDKSATNVSQIGGAGSGAQGAAGTGPGSISQSAVAPVDLNRAGAAGAAPSGPRVIYFDYDSFVIKPEFQALIDTNARFILADKNRRLSIEGHTDERGGREYNLALGQKRAEAVRRALGLLGVGEAQMEAVSFGKEKPAAEGSDEGAMSKNRRAELAYR